MHLAQIVHRHVEKLGQLTAESIMLPCPHKTIVTKNLMHPLKSNYTDPSTATSPLREALYNAYTRGTKRSTKTVLPRSESYRERQDYDPTTSHN